MRTLLEPIKAESLKDVFVSRFEDLILSGKIRIGQKLPSERELADQLGVSRPVVHEGIVELASKGLVTMKPRVGTVVNDYRREGSIEVLSSLINYHDSSLEPGLFSSLLEMRILLEVEFARKAAQNRTDDNIKELRRFLDRENTVDISDTDEVTALDFEFHLQIAIATGNTVYPLIINSFKNVYTSLSGQFFQDPLLVEEVFSFHVMLTDAIEEKDEENAVNIMKEMLDHGERHLRSLIEKNISDQGGAS